MNEKEKIKKVDNELNKSAKYDFDKNSFVVKPVFSEKTTDTLSTVLLRLMTAEK